ncbi:MAG TPA: UDP-N-acetylmuramoyl-L-alanine--D-glutamate ligase [Acidiphilium sp.]|jgi:UDP-N-acetylmuramoylalanine--D-glutamate ligase|uniref:UDP-N-acetylmuramoyl-L-alanine--D-glutamate ligase n=1 Tax=unclassified Acidiphilium TaxID=2617493 RepID=UPI000BCEFADC|nr:MULTISPECIES: UDP-N-acetylmuramoyl-L-alanine--D-glutamate ligase [unclassified Acidiphilium]OYV55705.1 MAG: UDP-N-acetylmuramoyl-L-alanine--D-glutamate ligase [Acidiphilium sp. 20-67-58]HQT60791.1 UDP-N-acetylmuramoyl-L-alanine--D-glutamate ligase [Acidiphilium sp.]HQU10738.1 UDP-N-acetylmuramoyl-L-alanine--D-glutamate ligase [Acidiphilium sp.]
MSAAVKTWKPVFAGRRFAVMGLGVNGLPAARALRDMGAEIIAWDDHEARRDAAAAEGIPLGRPSEASHLDGLVLSPGIPHALPAPHPEAAAAIARGVPILTDAELLFRAVRCSGSAARFVGITGTNGKSTTTALLAHILAASGFEVAAGGNLGPAALALGPLGDDGVYVLEMSSYMLERIENMRFCAGAMLNLTPDHLDRHGNMAGYEAAKSRLFAGQAAGDVAVFGIDDAPTAAMADRFEGGAARVVRISGTQPADIFARGRMLVDHAGVIADLSAAKALPGTHNVQNAAAAAALALALGVPRETIGAAMRTFPGLPHRQRLVATVAGVAFIDDSKATNAESAARALDCHDRLVWIAGGIGKEGGIESLSPWFSRIAHAVLIGRDAAIFAATLGTAGVSFEHADTLERAVPAAFAAAQRLGTGTVLLSPAAASFDQFTDYAARGRRFAELAMRLGAKEAM